MTPALKTAAGGVWIAMAVGLGACSASSPAQHATNTTHPGGARTSSPSSSTTSSPTSTTTTTAPAVVRTCRVPGLRIVLAGQSGAAGTQEITFSLTNSTAASCTTYGYPGLLLVATTGAPLPTTVVRGGGLDFERIAPAQVTLAAGETAYFNVGFSDVTTGTTTCTSTHTVEVTPPTTTTHATVNVALGIDACDDGTLHVSAVFSSTSSAATKTTAPS
jgi:hypothetical protein